MQLYRPYQKRLIYPQQEFEELDIETMPVPPPETFQWSPPFVYIPPLKYVEYEQEVAPYDPPYAVYNPDQSIYWEPIVAVPIYPTIIETGEVQYIDLEGGFYGIITDDGEHYEPNNLASEFMVDDLQISFKAKVMKDQVSFRMWGTIIEILEIEVLD